MNVLYDISVLGMAQADRKARTGVFRVVEEVAIGLAESPTPQLSFCSSASLETTAQSYQYLRANPRFDRIPFVSPKHRAQLHQRCIHRLEEINSKPQANFGEKVFKRVLFKTAQGIERKTEPLTAKILEGVDVFHSPFHSLPPCVRSAQNLKKFITIYDLIPVLHPTFFKQHTFNALQVIIDAIRPDDWILCISEATKRDLCEYRKDIDPTHVFVTHLAASDTFYPHRDREESTRIKQQYGIPPGPYLLSLSTLEPRKNIAQTIRCFARVIEQENIPDLSLVLVGAKGWDYESIFNELSRVSGLRDRVVVTGFVEDAHLAAIYSGAMAFIYPSFYEGFGLPPLEAMQCGIPVITSNTSSLPEVVGEAGFMESPDDADALCEKILAIYHSPTLREALSKKSLERSAHFSWERCTQQTLAAYEAAGRE